MNTTNTKELVSAYLNIRNERDRLKREYELADELLKNDMDELSQMMLALCNEVNADSIKTDEGTIMRQVKERFSCSDWDNFYKFVVENNVPQVLEKRIHQGNFKEFMSANPDDGLPDGVNVMKEYTITVRKPTSKV
jgi:hypothetical protein